MDRRTSAPRSGAPVSAVVTRPRMLEVSGSTRCERGRGVAGAKTGASWAQTASTSATSASSAYHDGRRTAFISLALSDHAPGSDLLSADQVQLDRTLFSLANR